MNQKCELQNLFIHFGSTATVVQSIQTMFSRGKNTQMKRDTIHLFAQNGCSLSELLSLVSVSSVAYDLSALSADLQQHRDALRESGLSTHLAELQLSGAVLFSNSTRLINAYKTYQNITYHTIL